MRLRREVRFLLNSRQLGAVSELICGLRYTRSAGVIPITGSRAAEAIRAAELGSGSTAGGSSPANIASRPI